MDEGGSTAFSLDIYKIGLDRPSDDLAVDTPTLHRVDSVIHMSHNFRVNGVLLLVQVMYSQASIAGCLRGVLR